MKKSKLILIAGAVIVAAGAFYYIRTRRIRTHHENLIEASRNFYRLDSYTTGYESTVEMFDEDGEEISAIGLSGSTDIDFTRRTASSDLKILVDSQGVSMEANFSLLFIDDILYGRIDSFPPIPFLDLSSATGIWALLYEDPLGDLDEILKEEIEEEVSLAGLYGEYKKLSLDSLKEDVKVTSLGEETVNGIDAHKYRLTYGKGVVDRTMDTFERMYGIFPDEIEDREKKMQEMRQTLEKLYLEGHGDYYVWTDGTNLIKHSYEFKLDADDLNGEKEELPGIPTPETVLVSLDLKFSNFNADFDIYAPQTYLSSEELLEKLQ